MQNARGGRWGGGGKRGVPWDRDRKGRRWRSGGRSRRRGELGLPRATDGSDPRSSILLRLGLEVIRARCGHNAKGVFAPLEHDGRACVHVLQVEQTVQLVFGRCLVVREVRRAQHEPSAFPGLCVCCGRSVMPSYFAFIGRHEMTHLAPFTLLPQVTRADVRLACSTWGVGRAPYTGVLFVVLRVLARLPSLSDSRERRWEGA